MRYIGYYRNMVETGATKLDVWNNLFKHYTHHIPFKKIRFLEVRVDDR